MEENPQQKVESVKPSHPKHFFTYFLIALCIILPIIGFYFGIQYQKNIQHGETNMAPEPSPSIAQPIVEKKESKSEILTRCGDIPSYSELSITQIGRSTQVSGPMWSPDCRHIAYGVWQSGISAPDMEPPERTTGENDFEGLFLYSDRTEELEKIYQPSPGETTEFIEWQDNNTILFKADGKTQQLYDLLTGSLVTPTEE